MAVCAGRSTSRSSPWPPKPYRPCRRTSQRRFLILTNSNISWEKSASAFPAQRRHGLDAERTQLVQHDNLERVFRIGDRIEVEGLRQKEPRTQRKQRPASFGTGSIQVSMAFFFGGWVWIGSNEATCGGGEIGSNVNPVLHGALDDARSLIVLLKSRLVPRGATRFVKIRSSKPTPQILNAKTYPSSTCMIEKIASKRGPRLQLNSPHSGPAAAFCRSRPLPHRCLAGNGNMNPCSSLSRKC